MNVDYIRHLYAYNHWANKKTLDAAAKLNSQSFIRDLANSFKSIRDTLVHILAAEWIWLERWNGNSPKSMFDPSDFADIQAIRTRWAEVQRDQVNFLEKLTAELLERPIRYVNTQGETWTYPLWQMMCHVVNHSSYHRG